MQPADLTATVRSAVGEALRTPGTDIADAIAAKLVESDIASIGTDILDLLTDLEEFLDGWTDPATEKMQVRVERLLDRLGVPQVKPALLRDVGAREGGCPRCGSRDPHLHPAVQFGGEVEVCTDDFHLTPTPQNGEAFRAAVLEKRKAGRGHLLPEGR